MYQFPKNNLEFQSCSDSTHLAKLQGIRDTAFCPLTDTLHYSDPKQFTDFLLRGLKSKPIPETIHEQTDLLRFRCTRQNNDEKSFNNDSNYYFYSNFEAVFSG